MEKVAPYIPSLVYHWPQGNWNTLCTTLQRLKRNAEVGNYFLQKFYDAVERKKSHVNPHEVCVVNKFIKGIKKTTIWNVGDIKISQYYPIQVTNILNCLEESFKVDIYLR